MAVFTGTSGDDVLRGTDAADVFNLQDGGQDKAVGGKGDDLFRLGGALGTSDQILGGSGFDTVVLDGDYSAGLRISGGMFLSIEQLKLVAGHDYDLTLAADVVAPGAQHSFTVDGAALGAGDGMRIDASAIDHKHITLIGGGGDDLLIGGGATGMVFDLTAGGNDTAIGGAGDDGFRLDVTAGDQIDGGAGLDYLILTHADTPVLLGEAVLDVETIALDGPGHFDLVASDTTLDHGEVLQIYADRKSAFSLDGSAETDGRWYVQGSALDDHLIGGARSDTLYGNDGDDTLQGGGGADIMDGRGGRDWFVYTSVADASATDTIWHIEARDVVDLSAIDADVTRDGNQKFHLVNAFTGHAGELELAHNGDLWLFADVDGDGISDLQIDFAGGDQDFSHIKF